MGVIIASGRRYLGSTPTTPAQLFVATNTMVSCPRVPHGQRWHVRQAVGISGNFTPPTTAKIGDRAADMGPNTNFASNFATTQGAAGVAAQLVANGLAYLSKAQIDFQAALPAGPGQIEIDNLAGGTMFFQMTGGDTQESISFPEPIPAPYASPTIKVPAITGGSAYTINAFGDVLGAGFINEQCNVFAGTVPVVPDTHHSNADPGDLIAPGLDVPFRLGFSPPIPLTQGKSVYADFWNAIGSPCIIYIFVDVERL